MRFLLDKNTKLTKRCVAGPITKKLSNSAGKAPFQFHQFWCSIVLNLVVLLEGELVQPKLDGCLTFTPCTSTSS